MTDGLSVPIPTDPLEVIRSLSEEFTVNARELPSWLYTIFPTSATVASPNCNVLVLKFPPKNFRVAESYALVVFASILAVTPLIGL